MVMERLGIDLQKFSDKNGVFKKSTVLQLGIRVVSLRCFTSNASTLDYFLVAFFTELRENKDYFLAMSVTESRKHFGEIINHGFCR